MYERLISAIQGLEFVGGRMSYIALRSKWCDIVMNAHAPTEDESGDSKDSFYEELEQVFDNFPKYHKILLVFIKKSDQRLVVPIHRKVMTQTIATVGAYHFCQLHTKFYPTFFFKN
jgi:hypothetical protein